MLEPRRRARRQREGSSRGWKLADVAKAANVSTATVSRVLNGNGQVDPVLKARVDAAVAERNWVPNASAKALASHRTRTIGAVIPTLDHQNFARAVERLESTLSDLNYKLLLGCSRYDSAVELRQVRTMVERGVDAVIVVGGDNKEELYDFLANQNVPCVQLYSGLEHDPNILSVGFGNYESSRVATKYLYDLGHRRFALLGHSVHTNDRLTARKQAVIDELAEHGLGIPPDLIVGRGWKIADGIHGFRKIMSTRRPPTVIVCANDYVALGCLIEAVALKIDVPGEVSVIGFDDVELASVVRPRLTTLRVPDAEVGQLAAQYVVDHLEGRRPPRPFIERARLIIRSSTGPPRATAQDR